MLHGYKLGHNYVQGSILLPSSHDMDKIATLSDWSEYVDKTGERDYITAYPLHDSPYYVIAKSWYAEEMRRPGCVWSHSLLIHRNDMMKIVDFRHLLTLFRRPDVGEEDFSSYSKTIGLDERANFWSSKGYSSLTEAKIAELYAAMVSSQSISILKEADNSELQELLLNLCNYLPTEMLWQRSFCSGTAIPRSYEGKPLSLQLVTHDGGNIISLNNKTPYYGSQIVAVSLMNEQKQLPNIIRHFESELGGDEQRLRGFLEVVVLANRVCKDEDEKQSVLLAILHQLGETFPQPTDGDNVKRAVLQASLARDLGGEEKFLYTVSTIDVSSFTEEQISYNERLKELSSEQFLRLLKQFYSSDILNDWGLKTVKNLDQFVSYAEINGLKQSDKVFFQTIIGNNTELLNQVVWADFTQEELVSTLSVFSNREIVINFKHWGELFKASLITETPIARDLARMILSHDKECVSFYLDYINAEGHHPQVEVSKELENYTEEVLSWLSSVSNITHDIAYILVNGVDETTSLVRNMGSKVWMPFANVLNEKDPIKYYVFLYILSFNWQDKEAFLYLRKAFCPIHALLAQDKLDYSLWYRIEPYTERLFFPFWDRCKKMRKMVIRRLKDAGYSKSVIANYTNDAQTNEWLVNEW